MKKILLLLIPGALAFNAQAQDIPTLKPYNNELGLFGQTEVNTSSYSFSIGGLQYKHWHSEHLGLRATAGMAQYRTRGAEVQSISHDTSYLKQERQNINLPMLGIGIEAQRHFYKKVYLFAAVELDGGYGAGKVDTVVKKFTNGHTGTDPVESFGSKNAALLYLGLRASVGAKIQFNRVALGLEISPVQATYTSSKQGDRTTGLMNMDLGTFNQRVFLHFRF